MKYIRTEEWIYEVEHEFEDRYVTKGGWTVPKKRSPNKNRELSMVAISEDLETLCDEFLVPPKHRMFKTLGEAKAYCDANKIERFMIRGAIWNSTGIAAVTWANSKGDLIK